MPPSPSQRSLYTAMLGNDVSTSSVIETPKYDHSNDGRFTFSGPNRQIGSENGETVDQFVKSGGFVEQIPSLRSGLVERRAARAGHSVPRLNTDVMKPDDNPKSQQTQSPYLTIPPGPSPTSFLDSPVFLSNSLKSRSICSGRCKWGYSSHQGTKSCCANHQRSGHFG
ncbi:probable WRKY transcription factor 2 [Rutidosis leptorrhynchoides]|uniref:probable WRKY transcription factor 2 n=1 Tax=Rutidosis leptorrhynchoides TaxID=125765 RepID=UPI003A990D3A